MESEIRLTTLIRVIRFFRSKAIFYSQIIQHNTEGAISTFTLGDDIKLMLPKK